MTSSTDKDPLAFTPVPRQRKRRRGWSPARQREFITHLADTGSVRAACRRMGVGEHQVYVLRNHPEGASFAAAWEAALDMGIQRIEDTAMDRALNGTEEPIYYHGEKVGDRTIYNDRLLMFLLSNRAPARFAQGNARTIGSVSPRELARLKKQWIAEHEAAKPNVSAAEVRASIDRKIMDIRRRLERERPKRRAVLSEETLAAFAHFAALRDRDLAAINADERTRTMVGGTLDTPTTFYDPPETPALPAPPREEEEPPQHPPEGYSYGKPKPAPPPKTVWTLKDESFDP